MKLLFEKIEIHEKRSVRLLEIDQPEFDAQWHFHPEWELTYIVKGHGTRFVGDSIELYNEGDFVLLGPDLPHFWHTKPDKMEPRSRAVVIQFAAVFPGETFLKLPELSEIRKLLEKASQGLHFTGKVADLAASRLEKMSAKPPLELLLELLSILSLLATSDKRPLSQTRYTNPREKDASSRLGKAYTYLITHFHEPISLADVAKAASMSPASFSRFFKRLSQKNLWNFLTGLRLNHACRLLLESDRSITEIAYESGFGTLSSFNRHFRTAYQSSPREYRKIAQSAAVDSAILPKTSSP